MTARLQRIKTVSQIAVPRLLNPTASRRLTTPSALCTLGAMTNPCLYCTRKRSKRSPAPHCMPLHCGARARGGRGGKPSPDIAHERVDDVPRRGLPLAGPFQPLVDRSHLRFVLPVRKRETSKAVGETTQGWTQGCSKLVVAKNPDFRGVVTFPVELSDTTNNFDRSRLSCLSA